MKIVYCGLILSWLYVELGGCFQVPLQPRISNRESLADRFRSTSRVISWWIQPNTQWPHGLWSWICYSCRVCEDWLQYTTQLPTIPLFRLEHFWLLLIDK